MHSTWTAKVLPCRFLSRIVHSPNAESMLAAVIRTRSALLSEAAAMVRFLFTPEDDFGVDPVAAGKVLTPASRPVLEAAVAAGEGRAAFDAASLEAALKGALIEDLGLKPKVAFGPVRVAVTGRTISPPLYESLELLGRDVTVRRLRSALGSLAG